MDSVPAFPGKIVPLLLAHWRDLRQHRPFRAALVLGAVMGPLGVLVATLVGEIVMASLPPELWGNSAAAHLGEMHPARIVIMAILLAPLLETLLAQVLPIELGRRLGAGPVLCILPSAVLFGLGHYLNGGLVHGTTTLFSGLVFASAYVALRGRGARPAFVAAASAHAVQNAIAVSFMLLQGGGAA